ncbi:ferrochelatase [Arcticibacter pallidicorallinus]|uniref:Ferrochelatase n=1 Tax=Arcticibacter pallidicorallinus TaxID=1259464 RepID=A0A2T0U9E3_9SPHI|nr:ferrochelatase [Arcticibacter pallidicorallinus]PRY54553.1 ferrochelatase [Arcticibacter pallidicorallinus]
MSKQGVLLVNLGTPDSPSVKDVRRYLDEFLMDERVIDISQLGRTLLVKGIIVPFRGPKSAKTYQKIWTDKGSPLMYYSEIMRDELQNRLGGGYQVELGMRYQNPSIESALNKLKEGGVKNIRVIALFPQYASATTGSVHQKVMEIVSKWQAIPDISFINSFHNDPDMISVFAENGRKHDLETYDHYLFSFHGLPQRQLIKGDDSKKHCLQSSDCCSVLTDTNKFCYSAQCHDTARLIAESLNIPRDKYTVTFQSRLGKEPWAQPYTSEVVHNLAKNGTKRLLVFSPAFVADCLETIYEIAEEYDLEFKELGGEKVQLVESLNTHPVWIGVLEKLATQTV